jgi:hypothetical protein
MRIWMPVSRMLLLAVYSQSIFAGVYLSGKTWGRDAHRGMAFTLVALTFALAIIAFMHLKEVANGPRFAAALFALAIGLSIQMAIGLRVADGDRLLWLHIPFGVALVGASAGLEASVRRLGNSGSVQ